MRGLKFDINHCGKKYEVYIQRELRHVFNTKSEATKFCNKCKSVLIDNITLLTEIAKWQYCYYNENFYYMDSFVTRKYIGIHQDYNETFSRIFYNSASLENKVSIQFNHLRNCFNLLEDSNRILLEYAKSNRERVLIKRMTALVKMLKIIRMQYVNEIQDMRFIEVPIDVRTLKITRNDSNNVLKFTGTP